MNWVITRILAFLCIFSRESQPKPVFASGIQGEGLDPIYKTSHDKHIMDLKQTFLT